MVWDSGQVASSEQAFVAYGGPALAPDTAYRWTVQTWDRVGPTRARSAPSTFETGLANRDWRAKWIGRADERDRRARPVHLRPHRVHACDAPPIVRARAYVSGDQQYELYVNGDPGRQGSGLQLSRTRMYYETLDVTGLLRAGAANAVGIVLELAGTDQGASRPASPG